MALLRDLLGNRIGHIAFAFLGMGGWAFWANRMHEMPAPLIAGVVQGMISASLTIVMQMLIIALFRWRQNPWLCILGASLMSLTTLLAMHTVARTPELLVTIALPWCIGVTYAVLFSFNTAKQARA